MDEPRVVDLGVRTAEILGRVAKLELRTEQEDGPKYFLQCPINYARFLSLFS